MKKNNKKIEKLIALVDWIMHMFGYMLVLILVSTMFDSIQIDKNHFIIYIEHVTYVHFKELVIFLSVLSHIRWYSSRFLYV